MNKTPRTIAASVILVTLGLAGCGSDEESSSTTAAAATTAAAPTTAAAAATTAAPAAGGAALEIKDFTFGAVTATAGEEIAVTNADDAPHTVTDDAGAFDVDVAAGGTATLTVDAAGTYAIHCDVHPKMTGTITIG